ncbi:MFS transporter [Candidatus Puniceispirillum marinum]|nr:MFS transporter [Candidatus Puniceispirillum marinum]
MSLFQNAAIRAHKVPVHMLGISQIVAYGALFYAFAPLKTHIATLLDTSEAIVMTILSLAIVTQALLTPLVGSWADRFGALNVLKLGFLLGASGFFGLGALEFAFLTSFYWLGLCFVLIGIGLAMSTYEVAFSAAVQFDEINSRKNISIISFYGGVASTLTWISIYPLISVIGLLYACLVLAAILLGFSWLISRYKHERYHPAKQTKAESKPFRWGLLSTAEKRAIIILASAGGFEYFLFSATTLLWVNWFQLQFENAFLAVILASIYGPFQVVGRLVEMKFGHHIDARITGLVAGLLIPLSLISLLAGTLPLAIVAMALFGMGHGILTVSFGFVTNLYFGADVYGRAKGWIGMPRVVGLAIGPSIGGFLLAFSEHVFISVMIMFAIASALLFASLMLIKPTNPVHIASTR